MTLASEQPPHEAANRQPHGPPRQPPHATPHATPLTIGAVITLAGGPWSIAELPEAFARSPLTRSGRIDAVRIDRDHGRRDLEVELTEAWHDDDLVLGFDLIAVVRHAIRERFGTVHVRAPAATPLPRLADGHPIRSVAPDLVLGLHGSRDTEVTREMATGHLGGDHAILSTPHMILLMERVAARTIEPYLLPGWSTVGVHLGVDHLSSALIGGEVTATCSLIGARGRRLRWQVAVHHGRRLIGCGTYDSHVVRRRG